MGWCEASPGQIHTFSGKLKQFSGLEVRQWSGRGVAASQNTTSGGLFYAHAQTGGVGLVKAFTHTFTHTHQTLKVTKTSVFTFHSFKLRVPLHKLY